jgi:hypothetical protein
MVADDGASELIGQIDQTRNAPCELFGNSKLAGPCVVAPLGSPSSVFGDAQCHDQPLATVDPACPAQVAVLYVSDDCAAWQPALVTIGAAVNGNGWSQAVNGSGTGQACVSTPVLENTHSTAPIASSAFPQIHAIHKGTGRVSVRYEATSADLLLRGRDFYDESVGETCRPTRMCDGSLRCLTGVPLPQKIQFKDAACTMQVIQADTYFTPCSSDAVMVQQKGDGVACAADRINLTALGMQYSGALYSLESGSCQASGFTPSPSAFAYYDDAGPVDPATLPLVQEVVE